MAEIEQDVAWTRAEWLSGAYAWIDRRLAEVGLKRTGSPERVHAYPWATVLRVPTTAADVFFKAMVPQLAHEAPAIAVLARLRPDLVTEVVVADPERGWMLMRDAGAPVRTAADERIEDWGRLLAEYARLQLAAADTVDELLAAGVPDRRLEKLPAQLAAVLADDDAVWAGREQGLTDEERAAIRDSTLPRFAALCAEAAALPVPETIQHDDLHGGQVFLRDGHWRILDWGDACVTHPFASLLIPLRSLVYREVVPDGAAELDLLRDAYLDSWAEFASREDLFRASEIGLLVARATRLLSWQHIVPHFDPPAREDYGESVPRWFRALRTDVVTAGS